MILALALAGASSPLFASDVSTDHVLFWMLDDPEIDGGSYGKAKASTMQSWGKLDSARVAAKLGDNDTIYLDLYYEEGGHWVVDPTANPPIDTAVVTAGRLDGGYARASLESTLGSDYALYSYAIELGTWGGDDGNKWIVAAISDWAGYADIQEYVSFQVDVPTATRWAADGFVAVPEPSSGVLLLIGGALLALRRKRRDAK